VLKEFKVQQVQQVQQVQLVLKELKASLDQRVRLVRPQLLLDQLGQLDLRVLLAQQVQQAQHQQ
jgi:hypothetical protein